MIFYYLGEPWGEWSECSKSCNRGEQEHFRVCYSVKTKTPFSERESQACNQISCYPPCKSFIFNFIIVVVLLILFSEKKNYFKCF